MSKERPPCVARHRARTRRARPGHRHLRPRHRRHHRHGRPRPRRRQRLRPAPRRAERRRPRRHGRRDRVPQHDGHDTAKTAAADARARRSPPRTASRRRQRRRHRRHRERRVFADERHGRPDRSPIATTSRRSSACRPGTCRSPRPPIERAGQRRHGRDAAALQRARRSRARSATRQPTNCTPRGLPAAGHAATRTCRRTPPSSTGRSSARRTATRATPTPTASATSSRATAARHGQYLDDDIGPLNAGTHTTLFDALLDNHIGGPVPRADRRRRGRDGRAAPTSGSCPSRAASDKVITRLLRLPGQRRRAGRQPERPGRRR